MVVPIVIATTSGRIVDADHGRVYIEPCHLHLTKCGRHIASTFSAADLHTAPDNAVRHDEW